MATYLLGLAYRGDAITGAWGAQADSLQRRLAQACVRLGEPEVWPDLASRTDAGVHALGQIAQVSLQRSWAPGDLAARLSAHLGPDVVCWGAQAVAPELRLPARIVGKSYRYTLDLSPQGDARGPFRVPFSWRPPHGLTWEALSAALAMIPHHFDSRGFHRRGEERSQTVTHFASARLLGRSHDLAVISLRGDRFAYHLVRSLVGGMVAVARNAVTTQEWQEALSGTANRASREQAPAAGLCLHRVHLQPAPAWVRPI
jgi:tRNA pseudouridine38-40 synthase